MEKYNIGNIWDYFESVREKNNDDKSTHYGGSVYDIFEEEKNKSS